MNDWPDKYEKVGIISNIGINATAWYSHASVMSGKNQLTINECPIVFYHYSGFLSFNKNEFDLCFYVKLPQKLIRLVYIPYINEIIDKMGIVDKIDKNIYDKSVKKIQDYTVKNYISY